MRHAAALTLVLALSTSAGAQDAPTHYTLEFDDPLHETGNVYARVKSETMVNTMRLMNGEQVIQNSSDDSGLAFAGDVEILEAADGKIVKEAWTFTKAVKLVAGAETPLSFQGKTITSHTTDSGTTYVDSDGTPVAEADLPAIRSAFTGKKKKKKKDSNTKKPSDSEVFSPGKPVAIGDSWDLDPVLLMKNMGMGEDEADVKETKGTLTFTGVEERNGVKVSIVTGDVSFSLFTMGPITFKSPMPMLMKMTFVRSLDPKRPSQTTAGTVEIKGERGVELRNAPPEADLSTVMEMIMDKTESWTRKPAGE